MRRDKSGAEVAVKACLVRRHGSSDGTQARFDARVTGSWRLRRKALYYTEAYRRQSKRGVSGVSSGRHEINSLP